MPDEKLGVDFHDPCAIMWVNVDVPRHPTGKKYILQVLTHRVGVDATQKESRGGADHTYC